MDDFAELLIRLENWRRWCRLSKAKGHCRSIEHRYRSPQWGHWDAVPPPIQGQIDIIDAGKIEDALKSLHWRERLFIRLVYYRQWKPEWVMNKFVMRAKEYDRMNNNSLNSLIYSLNTNANKPRVASDNLEIEPPMLVAA